MVLPLAAMTRAAEIDSDGCEHYRAHGYICDSPTNKRKHIVRRQQL
jgi:hypothetical protein